MAEKKYDIGLDMHLSYNELTGEPRIIRGVGESDITDLVIIDEHLRSNHTLHKNVPTKDYAAVAKYVGTELLVSNKMHTLDGINMKEYRFTDPIDHYVGMRMNEKGVTTGEHFYDAIKADKSVQKASDMKIDPDLFDYSPEQLSGEVPIDTYSDGSPIYYGQSEESDLEVSPEEEAAYYQEMSEYYAPREEGTGIEVVYYDINGRYTMNYRNMDDYERDYYGEPGEYTIVSITDLDKEKSKKLDMDSGKTKNEIDFLILDSSSYTVYGVDGRVYKDGKVIEDVKVLGALVKNENFKALISEGMLDKVEKHYQAFKESEEKKTGVPKEGVEKRSSGPTYGFGNSSTSLVLQIVENADLLEVAVGEREFNQAFNVAVEAELTAQGLKGAEKEQERKKWNDYLAKERGNKEVGTAVLNKMVTNAELFKAVLTPKQFSKIFNKALDAEVKEKGFDKEDRRAFWQKKMEGSVGSEFTKGPKGKKLKLIKETRVIRRLIANARLIEFFIGRKGFNKIFKKAVDKESNVLGRNDLDKADARKDWNKELSRERTRYSELKYKKYKVSEKDFMEENGFTKESFETLSKTKGWSELRDFKVDDKTFKGKLIVNQINGKSVVSIVERREKFDPKKDKLFSVLKDDSQKKQLLAGKMIAVKHGDDKEVHIYKLDKELNQIIEVPRNEIAIPKSIDNKNLQANHFNKLLAGGSLEYEFEGKEMMVTYDESKNKMSIDAKTLDKKVSSPDLTKEKEMELSNLIDKKDFNGFLKKVGPNKQIISDKFLVNKVIKNSHLSMKEKTSLLGKLDVSPEKMKQLFMVKNDNKFTPDAKENKQNVPKTKNEGLAKAGQEVGKIVNTVKSFSKSG